MAEEKMRVRAKCFILTRDDLENYLVKELGQPIDSVVTNIGGRPGNQEAWLVTVQSDSFEPARRLDVLPTDELKLLDGHRELNIGGPFPGCVSYILRLYNFTQSVVVPIKTSFDYKNTRLEDFDIEKWANNVVLRFSEKVDEARVALKVKQEELRDAASKTSD